MVSTIFKLLETWFKNIRTWTFLYVLLFCAHFYTLAGNYFCLRLFCNIETNFL